jgi:putative hydrolase of the HAD superfamily
MHHASRTFPSQSRLTLAATVNSLRAVTFDAGGTLIEPWPSVGAVYAEVGVRHGVRGLSAALLDRRFTAVWRSLKQFNYTRAEWADVVDRTFEGLTEAPPSQTFFEEIYERFSEPEAWRIFDDVAPALESLAARGLKLGLISNWDDRLVPLLRRLNLFDYFNTVVVSCDVGASKPAPEIFRRAAEMLAVDRRAILHIGDSASADVQGARAADFQALLLKRGVAPGKAGQISSLRELLPLLPKRNATVSAKQRRTPVLREADNRTAQNWSSALRRRDKKKLP